MKKHIAVAVMAAGMTGMQLGDAQAMSNGANDWPQWYLGLSAGISWQDDTSVGSLGELSFDDGTGFSAALGYRPRYTGYASGFRFEVEYLDNRNDVDAITAGGVPTLLSGDMTTRAGMFNIVYDFENDSRLTPYLGAGAGFADVDLSTNGVAGNDTVIGYQFLAGVSYSPSTVPFVDFGVGYRYFQTEDPELTPGVEVENSAHNAELNVRMNF